MPSHSTHIYRSITCAIPIAYVWHCAKGFYYALFLPSLSHSHLCLWPYGVQRRGFPATRPLLLQSRPHAVLVAIDGVLDLFWPGLAWPLAPCHCAIYPAAAAHSCSGTAITIRCCCFAPAGQPVLGAGAFCPVPPTPQMPKLLCRHGEAASHVGTQSQVCGCPGQSVRRLSQRSLATHCLRNACEAPVASLLGAGLPASMLLRTRPHMLTSASASAQRSIVLRCTRGRDLATCGPSRAD